MAEKEANPDQSKTKSSSTITGTESSVGRNLLSVTNYGKTVQYIYSDGSVHTVRVGDDITN
jgi:formylmethanofuran dehydrogenase subunit E